MATYMRNVHALYDGLPEDKTVRPGTLARWQRTLLEGGYSPRTVNVRMSVANSLMAFLGRRDLQSVGSLEVDDVQPELTRTEYLRLLTTARALDKERLYLLVKLFGCTGLPLQELPRVTVEALTEGRVIVRSCGIVQLPTPGGRGRLPAPFSIPRAENRWAAPPSRTASNSCAGTPGYRRKKPIPAV